MIDRNQASDRGVRIIDSDGVLPVSLIERVKEILGNIINTDNRLNPEALREFLEISNTSNDRGYELTFAGKGMAKAMADTPTEYGLKVEREQSKGFDDTGNVLIRGDNLEALKILYQNYHNRIKMIYIDPPYNTQSDEFIYKDNFKKNSRELIEQFGLGEDTQDFLHDVYGTKSHSGWLSFIYPRLKLARELLREDGVIFISIDDNEQAGLKVLCDEIFGEGNCVATLVWNTKKGAQGMITKNLIVRNHEYILVFAKNSEQFKFKGLVREEEGFSNPDNDPRGLWKRQYLQRLGQGLPTRTVVDPETKRRYSFETPYAQDRLERWVEENRIIFPTDTDKYPARKEFLNEYTTNQQLITHLGLFATKASTEKLYELFDGVKIFTNPKPDTLLLFLLKATLDEGDTVLDFFAGSGTTGDALMQLNAEDGGKRKFILVQLDEEIDPQKNQTAYRFCQDNRLPPLISSLTIERLNRAGEKIVQGEKEREGMFKEELDIGYRVYSLEQKPSVSAGEHSDYHITHIRSVDSTLANMLSATCKTLDQRIECLVPDKVYQADGEVYVVDKVNPAALEAIAGIENRKINLNGWSEIDLATFLNIHETFKENLTVVY